MKGLFLAAVLLVAAGCEKSPQETLENATPSPNASILPAPLSSMGQPAAELPPATRATSDSPRKPPSSDAATVTPEALRGDQPPSDDPLSQRELQGVTLEAEWHYPDAMAPAKVPEWNAAGVDAARKATAARMTIDLASVGRMRVTFDSRALPLARGSEIRARTDLYGHLLIWPNESQYRTLPPGAVRTLLGERRVDAVPLVRAHTSGKADGPRRIGLATRRWDLDTRTGKLSLEQARMAGAGEGGALLCRFLSEIVAIDPSAAPCSADDVPLRAQYAWPEGGGVIFEVTSVAERVEFAGAQLLVPPSGGEFTPESLPPNPGDTGLLTKEELASFRVRAIDAPGPRAQTAPPEGLALVNGTDTGRFAFVDGVPVSWVAANRDQLVGGLPRGRYTVQWRTFLGDTTNAPTTVDLPARVAVSGEPDRPLTKPAADAGR